MDAITLQDDIQQRLTSLTRSEAENWIIVGRLLLDLEGQSRADPEGIPWQDVVKKRLKELGASVSTGHIYKIRRAVGFLIEHAPDAITSENPSQPKISAVEVAERLYRLDPNAGKKALNDVVGQDPVTYVELQRRYEEALEAHPEMKSPRQIAWEVRRKVEKPAATAGKRPEMPLPNVKEERGSPSDQHGNALPATMLKRQAKFLIEIWAEAQNAAEAKFAPEIAALRTTIETQAEEIALSAQTIQELEAEIAIVTKKFLELRGDYTEDLG